MNNRGLFNMESPFFILSHCDHGLEVDPLESKLESLHWHCLITNRKGNLKLLPSRDRGNKI